MQLTNEDWKYKIINASPTRLVIVTYELVLDRMLKAQDALSAGDKEGMRESINNAKEFVTELMASLDTSGQIGKQMADLYMLVNKLLTKTYFSLEEKPLLDGRIIITKLMNGLMKEVDDQIEGKASVLDSGNYSKAGKD